MKKVILTLALAFSVFTVTKAQQNIMSTTGYAVQSNIAIEQGKTFLNTNYSINDNDPVKDYNYYIRKSRTLRITGLSLLGAGVVLGVSGILVSGNSNYTDYVRRDRTLRTLFIMSAATGIASIPFMALARASKNKAKAALSSQKTFIPGKANKYITGVTVSIPIGK